MAKQWIYLAHNHYGFTNEKGRIAELRIDAQADSNRAQFTFDDQTLTLSLKGFWRNHFTIINQSGSEILVGAPKSWYAHSLQLQSGSQFYTLEVRNNPLAEWVILQDGREILSYGLKTKDGKIWIGIDEFMANPPIAFHFLLWYYFAPVATEVFGNDYVFA